MNKRAKVLAVIPARYGSTRFKGKVVADLLGKPLIEHVYRNVLNSRKIDKVVIATDDKRVEKVIKKFGADVVMTPKSLVSGTERVSLVAKRFRNYEIVVNIQGDEPLLDMRDVDKAAAHLLKDKTLKMASLYFPIESEKEITNPNVVKVVKDKNDFAIYFSRFPIPYVRDKKSSSRQVVYYKHIGLYCYRRDFLLKLSRTSSSMLADAEKLEQLNVLERGNSIKMVKASKDTVGVDTKADLLKVKRWLLKNNKK